MTKISATGQRATVNMMRLFKRRLLSAEELKAIVKSTPQEERYLGHLPTDWFGKRKTNEEISELTQKVFASFSRFATGVYSKINMSPVLYESFIKYLRADIRQLTKHRASMEYVGRGLFGKVFKLKVKGKEYALKVFHMSDRESDLHGKSKEIANAIAYNHAKSRRRRADFYFGKIAGENDMDGFILTEFVPGEMVEKNLAPRRYEYRRYSTNDAYKGYNTINGKLVDFGDISDVFTNKMSASIAKQLLWAIQARDYKKAYSLILKYENLPEYREAAKNIFDRYQAIRMNKKVLRTEHTVGQRKFLEYFSNHYIKKFKIKIES
ncbi:MAG: hypothetical protein K6A44_04485 [bacterium]|nr:hypothetical protein [bacterium]